jgi:hypothetical protein
MAKYLYVYFQRPINFDDKWRQATVGKAGWIFNGFLSRGDF